jgi:hypothetical protein
LIEKGTQRECAFVALTHGYADQPANGRAASAADKDQCQGDWIIHRFFRSKCLTEPLQEIFSRQAAKNAKKKQIFAVSPNLARFASLRESSLFRLNANRFG